MSEIYPSGDHQVSNNLGLALWGTDEVTTDNFLLIDSAFGSISSSLEVNGVLVPPIPNFVNSPSVTITVVGSNISFTAAGSSGAGFPTRFVTVVAPYTAVAGDFVLCDTSGGGFTV